MYIVTSPTCFG